MTFHTPNLTPRAFTNFDDYADAMCHEAIKDLPKTSPYNDHAENFAIRTAIRVAMDASDDLARERWQAHIEHMEDLYERGVGPAWEGMA